MTSEAGAEPNLPGAEPTDANESPREPELRRLHPAATLIDAAGFVRAALLPVIIVMFGQGLVVGVAVTGLLVAIAAAFAFVSWRTEVYFVADGSLHHRTGLLNRKEQVIPATRISALDTQRGIIQRIFGIVGVQVQTAGGGSKAELSLKALTFADAEQLRLELGHRSAAAQPGSAPARAPLDADANSAGASPTFAGAKPTAAAPAFYSPNLVAEEASVVFKLSPRELLVAALTSPSIAVVGAAGAGLASFAQDAVPQSFTDDLADRAADLSVMAALVFVAALIVVAAAVSIAGTALLYGGFTVTRGDDRLRVRRGILTERVGTVPLDRVHGVRVIESPLRQLLGYASVEVEVAAYAGQDEVARTIVPLVRRAELAETLTRILPRYTWPEEPFVGVPARARRRFLTVPLCVAVVPAVALAAAPIGLGRLLALAPLAFAAIIGRQAARDAGWRRDAGVLSLRWRTFARYTVVAPEHRLQRSTTAANPFQRHAALATFAVRLSSAREAAVKHLDAGVAHDLLGTAMTHRSRDRV